MSADCFTKVGRKKHSYQRKSDAFKASQQIQKEGGPYLRPYQCTCGNYHLSSQKKKGNS